MSPNQLQTAHYIIIALLSSADLNTTSETIPMTFMPRYDLTKCIEITAVQDNVIESEEFFMIELSVATVLPANIQNNLKIGRSSTVISIQDTSKIHAHITHADLADNLLYYCRYLYPYHS